MRSWILQSVVALAVLLRTVGPADAEEPWIDDLLQTIRARQILHDDEELRGLLIGVSVRNRVATLWGPVPKLDLGLRAESCLRGVPEIRDVRNELAVQELPLRFATTPIRQIPGMPIESSPRLPPAAPPMPKLGPPVAVPHFTR
jgi:hypothetical protein